MYNSNDKISSSNFWCYQIGYRNIDVYLVFLHGYITQYALSIIVTPF